MTARVPPPPKKGSLTTRFVTEVPLEAEAPRNLAPVEHTDYSADLNFKVSPEFKQEFRVMAARRNMKLKELLEASFAAYKQLYGEN